METALKYGADTVMDLSTGENICEIRKAIIDKCPAPIGTVPMYEAVSRVDDPMDLTAELIIDVIKLRLYAYIKFLLFNIIQIKHKLTLIIY